jgi:hypothetical protein
MTARSGRSNAPQPRRCGRRIVCAGIFAVVATCGAADSLRAAYARAPMTRQGPRVVDVVTLGDLRSEREHEYAGEGTTDVVANGAVVRRITGWIGASLTTYDDTEVTIEATVVSDAGVGAASAFELLVDGQRIETHAAAVPHPATSPSALSVPSTAKPSFERLAWRVPFSLTKGKTRIGVVLRVVRGRAPAVLDLRTVQEHLELW